MSRFEIKLFGSIEIYHKGQPITHFRSQKALALLAFLITEDRPVTREYLAGLIWPEATQAQALGLLRRSLYSLSKQLPDCLETSQRTISFRQDAPAHIDTRQFAQLAAQNDTIAWTAAIDLYRASFLEGVYLSDCPAFEQWLITEQRRWQDQADDLLARLIQALIDQGDYRTALTYANRRLALAPWQEETHQQMMRLLLYNGQRNAALAQYDQCVVILDDELGVDPSPETQALYEQIKQAEPYPPHNLLPSLMPFLGRQTELRDLTRLIAHPKQRLITLVGPGGMGKTRLAIAVAERQLGRPTETPDADSPTYAYFTHGIYLVSLVAVQTASGLVPAITDALNFQLAADTSQRTPKQQLLDYLRQKRLLLILDNFEQLLQPEAATEATGLLLEILQTAPEVQLLITSRERLQVAAEQVYTVQGLAYPDTSAVAELPLADYPAIALFNQTAQHIRSDFRCAGEVAVAVAHICRMLQGMPLGIELAAAMINVLSPAEILNELTHSLDSLATTTRHIPARHRSIRAAFETSWQQLSRDEQAVFQKLSVFQGGFTKEAAQTVADASLPVLAELANKSFIRYRQKTRRYDIHELLRQFGAEQLGQSAELEKQTRQQHSQFFATKLAQWAIEIKGPQQQATYQAIASDNENFHQAWQWLLDAGQFSRLAQAIDVPGLFYRWQGRYQEGVVLYQAICQRLQEIIELTAHEQKLLIKALTWQGAFEYHLGHREAALALLEAALTYNEAHPAVFEQATMAQAFLWHTLGDVYRHTARDQAKAYFEQSLTAYETLEDIWGIAQATYGLSSIARELGDYPAAKDLAQHSLDLRETIGDQRGVADSLGWLGIIAMDMGELDQAEEFLLQKLTLYHQLDNLPGLASSLDSLGLMDLFLGRFEMAQARFEEGLAILNDLGDQKHIGQVNVWLGIALCMQGRYQQAHTRGRFGLSLVEDAGDLYGIGHAGLLLGYVNLILGQVADAQASLQTSIDIFQQLGQRDELSQAWAWMGYVELDSGQIEAAQMYLARCLQIVLEVRTILPVLEALPAAARLLCLHEEPALAVEIYALAMTYPMLAKSTLIEDLAGRYIDEAAKMLPPDIVAAAEEQGRQRDLWKTAAELLQHFKQGYKSFCL